MSVPEGTARLSRGLISVEGGTWTTAQVAALQRAHMALWPGARSVLLVGGAVTNILDASFLWSRGSGAGGTADAPVSETGAHKA